VVVAVGLAGCGGGRSDDSAAKLSPEARFAVGTRFETFVDRSRPTNATADSEAKPDRTFQTLVTYPAAGPPGRPPASEAPPATGGPFPLVVFSHGSGVSSPARYELLFNAWAAAGYVVAAPKYPLSSTSLPGANGDAVNQPADVSFLISEMVRLGANRASRYAGLVDGERVAVAGHSLGAATTLGVAFNGCCVDRRIDAGIVMAGSEAFFPNEQWFNGIRTPILIVHGDDDRIVRLADGQKVFADAPPPKAMLTLFGGDHNRPYGGSLATTDNPERLGATLNGPTTIVNAAAVAFLDHYVKDQRNALARLRTALADEVSVKLELVE
jgi:dienelactone hydrolase